MRKQIVAAVLILLWATTSFAQTAARKGKIEITGDTKVSELIKKHIEFNDRTKTVPGYRIQIATLSGANSRNRAFELKQQFKTDFPDVEVYIIFTEPNFRVKVGDFISKLDAYVFMHTIESRYPGNIVKEKVYPIHLDWSDIVPETDNDAEL